MISGRRKSELTAEEIFKLISNFDIYKYYFGNFKINEPTFNHLRGENNRGAPSFIIGNRYGDLLHYDFSAGKDWSGNCFQLVQQIYNCTYDEALRIIDRDFGLGILPENNSGKYKEIKKEYRQPVDMGKRYSLIQMVTRKFTKEELYYWKMYYQTEEDLKIDHIYSIKEMFLNKKRFPLGNELRFGYLYEGGYWKLYRPYEKKKGKWISNVPLTTAYGLNNLKKKENTLICKSLKDYKVCRKIYPYVCHVQNESISAFSEETVKIIKENSKDVFYGGDSDEMGKHNSWIITENFGFHHINPPDKYLPEINDFADWGKAYGLIKLKEHFINKGVLL